MNFLGLEFTPLTFDHKELLDQFFKKYPEALSEYTSSYLLAANCIYSYSFTFLDRDILLISFFDEQLNQRHLLQPIGNFSDNKLLSLISKNSYAIKIAAVTDSFINSHPDFCSHFLDFNDRNLADYLYKAEDLATLHGRHYEKKRNLVAQANRLYNWNIEELNVTHHPYCPLILENIGQELQSERPKDLENERQILHESLSHFDKLNFKGCIIIIDNQPVAFSIYTELNKKTVDIYFEKAVRKFKGLSQLINQESAKIIFQAGYEFINREEDLGLDGLRQAKLSYHPFQLINYHVLTWDVYKHTSHLTE